MSQLIKNACLNACINESAAVANYRPIVLLTACLHRLQSPEVLSVRTLGQLVSIHVYRRRLINADSCTGTVNDLMLFRCPSPAETDPSIGVNVYVHHTDSCPRQPTAGLWQQYTGWHPNVPGTPDAVSTERCSTANLQPQAL